MVQQKQIWLVSMRMQVRSLALLSVLSIWHCSLSCGVGFRHSLDPELLWLWCSLASTSPIRPLAWECPYATGMAPNNKQTNKNLHRCSGLRIWPWCCHGCGLGYSYDADLIPGLRTSTCRGCDKILKK